jgi:predicted nucleic acid-binding protein
VTRAESKVVDSWALLAWIRNEQPAAEHVRDCLSRAEEGNIQIAMSWINAGEVYYMLARKHDTRMAERFLRQLPSLPIHLVVPKEPDIIAAAKLKATRKIAYADAFAAALAQAQSAALVTGDPELGEMSDVITIEWIGPKRSREA